LRLVLYDYFCSYIIMTDNTSIKKSIDYLNLKYDSVFKIDRNMNIYIFSARISAFIELVNYWSQILGYVIYACNDHKIRKKIVANLMDENCGKLTHVETFYQFLIECGYEGELNNIKTNSIVTHYKDLLYSLITKYTFEQSCSILGSIEHVYHIISKEINNYFKDKKGYQPENHYTTHEIVDVKHAIDLFECSNDDSLTPFFLDIGAHWIIDCLNGLLEFKPVFGYTYEDCDVEKYAISLSKKQIKDGLIILSGGDTMFELADKIQNLSAIDMNLGQVKLVMEKIKHLKNHTYSEFLLNLENTKIVYDNLFYKLKNGDSFENVFNIENLKKDFGEQAVKNTTKDFAQHFISVSENKGIYHSWIFDRNLQIKIDKSLNFNIDAIENVNIEHNLFEKKLFPDMYDFIQTSNITDWMDNSQFLEFCKKVKSSLRSGGILVMRRLASNNFLSPQFPNSINISDKTDLYSETIIWIK